MVTRGLNTSKKVALYDGDDREIAPRLLKNRDKSKPVGIVFDGSKRFQAYEIYKKIKHQVAFAVFDDADMGQDFSKFLEKNEKHVWWSNTPNWVTKYRQKDNHACGLDDIR